MSRYWHRQVSATPRVAKAIYDPRVICAVVCLFVATSSIANPIPTESVSPSGLNQSETTIDSLLLNHTANTTANDLYVIKAVVYEIGILTDADNSTNETTESHEQVNISFFDPPRKDNGLLDLSGIPVPQIVAPTN